MALAGLQGSPRASGPQPGNWRDHKHCGIQESDVYGCQSPVLIGRGLFTNSLAPERSRKRTAHLTCLFFASEELIWTAQLEQTRRSSVKGIL